MSVQLWVVFPRADKALNAHNVLSTGVCNLNFQCTSLYEGRFGTGCSQVGCLSPADLVINNLHIYVPERVQIYCV